MIFKDFPNIDFLDETQEEFDERMVKYHQEWDNKNPPRTFEDFSRRQRILKEAEENFDEIPKLTRFVDKYYGKPPKEFEARLRRFADARKKI